MESMVPRIHYIDLIVSAMRNLKLRTNFATTCQISPIKIIHNRLNQTHDMVMLNVDAGAA